jgi:hypothetical protein
MSEEFYMSDEVIEKELKKLKHYVDNTKFLEEMSAWKKEVNHAEKKGKDRPPVSTYIAECFIKIAEHLAQRPNFINYPFKEDMVGDGIENCIAYAHNFDPEKSSNPFSYFTQIIYYAFLRRIEREKKQSYIKYKCIQMNDVDGKFVEWLKGNQGSSTFSEFLQNTFFLSEHDIEKMEKKEKLKKKRGKKPKNKS